MGVAIYPIGLSWSHDMIAESIAQLNNIAEQQAKELSQVVVRETLLCVCPCLCGHVGVMVGVGGWVCECVRVFVS